MRLKLFSDGTQEGTRVVTESGEEIEDIVGCSLEMNALDNTMIVTVSFEVPETLIELKQEESDESIIKRNDRWFYRDENGKLLPSGGLKSHEAAEVYAESLQAQNLSRRTHP
jgi:hypothetical protein